MIKLNSIVTGTALSKEYDKYATTILASSLESIPRTKKGERQKYQVVAKLPTIEQYAKMRDARHSLLVEDLAGEVSELESLRDELQEWYDNLPESLRGGSKGDELQEAINGLDSASSPPELPECLSQVRVVFHPGLDVSSRSERCAEAIAMITLAIEAGREFAEALPVGDENKEAITQWADVSHAPPPSLAFATLNSPLSSFGNNVSRKLARMRDCCLLSSTWMCVASAKAVNFFTSSTGGTTSIGISSASIGSMLMVVPFENPLIQ
jgi:hypothetical protein